MRVYKDSLFNFYEFFNEKNGFLIRTDIISDGVKIKPFKRDYPELIDIGIMGHCNNRETCRDKGILCYQSYSYDENMSFDDYCSIIEQSKGKTFQVALGGRGDPNKHEFFEDILKYTVDNSIVPNLTTSGFDITDKEIELIKKYCGAVAVSCYSKIENDAETNSDFKKLVESFSDEVITNIHYVISNETIDDAILRLENNLFPNNINSVIFLLYKPVGAAIENCTLCKIDDVKLDIFFTAAFNKKHNYKIGFDSCFSSIVSKYYADNDFIECIQYCESGRFSCYISPDMKMYPCSFAQLKLYECDLRKQCIQEAWFSAEFKRFVKLNKDKIDVCPLKLNIIDMWRKL